MTGVSAGSRFIQPIFRLPKKHDEKVSIHSWEMNQPLNDTIYCDKGYAGSSVEDLDLINIHHALVALNVHPELRLSVNVRIDMLTDKYANILIGILDRNTSVNNRLTIEMVEHGYFTAEGSRREAISTARFNLERIKRSGVSLSIDDYGTGHNSAEVGLWGVWDEIKIDRVIIETAASGSVLAKDMVKGMTDLYQDHEIKVVYEGIESKTMMDLAFDNDADFVQGYFLSVPVMTDIEDIHDAQSRVFLGQ